MAKSKHLSDKQKDEIFSDIIKGVSYRRIAEKHKISSATVSRLKKEREKFVPPVS